MNNIQNVVVGYDLDGVLVPDINTLDCETMQKAINIRDKVNYPIFKPQGPWGIISGRPHALDFDSLNMWVHYHFKNNPPRFLELLPGDKLGNDEKVAGFKAKCIKEHQVKIFFESSYEQCQLLMRYIPFQQGFDNTVPVVRVHWWSAFITNAISQAVFNNPFVERSKYE